MGLQSPSVANYIIGIEDDVLQEKKVKLSSSFMSIPENWQKIEKAHISFRNHSKFVQHFPVGYHVVY